MRTPVTSFKSQMATVQAVQLGAVAVKAALERGKVAPSSVQELIFGCVVAANTGQAPSTQVARLSGIPNSANTFTVNKVCASGMKAIQLAAQSVQLGHAEIVVAGGMESMSNVPYYL